MCQYVCVCVCVYIYMYIKQKIRFGLTVVESLSVRFKRCLQSLEHGVNGCI